MKLNQVIAIDRETKGRVYSRVTEQDRLSSKPELFDGFSKEYQPLEADGEVLNPESKRVQVKVVDQLAEVRSALSELFDVTATKDFANCNARADVVVDGKILLESAPVPYLLVLEKQLTDLRTLIGRIPVLDSAYDWKYDSKSQLHRTDPLKTHRTKKVQKGIVLHGPTKEHPAQTQLITEDILAGHWSQTKLSGAIAESIRKDYLKRIEILLKAVVQAREEANMIDAPSTFASKMLGFIFE